uniref:Cytochrome P450 71A1-like n=1 Tax=Ananas comosus var. bracteatus TaxID=296719 RepID=A0A6V7QY54_ANACO
MKHRRARGFFIADYLPIIGWADWLTGMRARLEKNFIDLDRFYQQVLDEHLDRAQQQQRDSSEDLVDILLRMQKDEKSLTTDQIKGALMHRKVSMALLHMIASLPFVVLLLLPLLLLTRRKEGSTSLKTSPGPPKLPGIGNLHQLGRLPHHSLSRLSQRYGPLMYLKLGHEPTIVVSSANMAQEILKTHDLECCSRPPRTSHTKLSYGCSDIAFAVYGGPWRELRRISIIELFSAKKIASFRSIREEEVERTMSSISSYSSSSLPVDLSKELIALTSTITCRMAFGRSYHDVGSRFQMILNEAQAMLGGFFISDYLPIIGWADWLTGMRARLEKNFIDLDRFYQQVLDEHLDRAQQLQRRDSSEDLVDILLRMQKDEKSLTTDQIKGALMNVFIGGSDTSSATAGWAMTELMRHPQAMEKAQEEVTIMQKSISPSNMNG